MGWEHALKLSTDATVDEMFKTVSKSAVQNLSPSKCRSPNETERDFDDFEDVSNDSDSRDIFVSDEGNVDNADLDVGNAVLNIVIADSDIENPIKLEEHNTNAVIADSSLTVNSVKSDADAKSSLTNLTDIDISKSDTPLTKADLNIKEETNIINETKEFEPTNSDLTTVNNKENSKEVNNIIQSNLIDDVNELNDSAKCKVTSDSNLDKVLTVPATGEAALSKSSEFLNSILNDNSEPDSNGRVLDNDFKDPMNDFTDVDLS